MHELIDNSNSNYREALNAFLKILDEIKGYDEHEHEHEHEKCIVVERLLTTVFQNADNGLSALRAAKNGGEMVKYGR